MLDIFVLSIIYKLEDKKALTISSWITGNWINLKMQYAVY